MVRLIVVGTCLLAGTLLWAADEKRPLPSFDYDAAKAHELKPHRRMIPIDGAMGGFNQLHLTLTISTTGDVTSEKERGDAQTERFWPEVRSEVSQWKFTPFEVDGVPVKAEVEEYVDLVPLERLPKRHVVAPVLRGDSKVTITLERTGCFGTCPGYTVEVSTSGIVFNGRDYVAAPGRHTASVDAEEVRKLTKSFIAADFYSMDESYSGNVSDNPTYILSIAIDGRAKKVQDYVGAWDGMPAVITELEEEVDTITDSQRWVNGAPGLVRALRAEKFDFRTFEAQAMLKVSANRGQTETVRDLLEAGVPLTPNLSRTYKPYESLSFQFVGWLTAAGAHPDTLQVLLDSAASKNDQGDKDLALAGAAGLGNVKAARALIAYGANPNSDLEKLTVSESVGGMTRQQQGAGSVLINAARSGSPEMVREILLGHPELETRDSLGKTAMFAAARSGYRDRDGARVQCVRLLAEAGADVNARDKNGNTPLHEIFVTDVAEELLKVGADLDARNKDGETPIFTAVDDDAIPMYVAHGADLTIRNKKGDTVVEAAKQKGPLREKALRDAIQKLNER